MGIRVRALAFSAPPFRKLGNFQLDFADRLTLIAGHNGIGKSTILGLVANTFGIASRTGPRNYFGDLFFANIERIVFLALEEVAKAQEHPNAAPVVIAEVGDVTVRKRCSMTQRGQWKRARVVPRTVDRQDADPVGQDAKVPLPTIYLGIRRLASIGEADEKDVVSTTLSMPDEDSALIADFVRAVILGSEVNTATTHQSIRGANKKTVQPGYGHHGALAVSMGQDSLASIATALASFNRLKREMGENYPGGLLIIDELDVGFHPHALGRLAKELKTQAKRLDLQIIATTHSPRLIEAIHPEGEGNRRAPDRVAYLLDTRSPRLAEDQSLAAILNDMALRDDVPSTRPNLCVYFEDAEGSEMCNLLIPSAARTALGKKYGVKIRLVPLGVGGSNLLALPDKDPLFASRVLIVDADTSIPQKALARGNSLKLPTAAGARGKERSPENTVKNFLKKLVTATEGPLHESLLRLKTTNPSTDKVLNTFLSDSSADTDARESGKSWWATHLPRLKSWGVIEEWATIHAEEVAAFRAEFEQAIAKTSVKVNSAGQAAAN